MANSLSGLSVVCFVLSGVCFLEAIILSFLLEVKNAYLELKGKPIHEWKSENEEEMVKVVIEQEEVTRLLITEPGPATKKIINRKGKL